MERIEDRIKYTPKGFSYIEVTPREIFAWGGMCICNGCNEQITKDTMNLSFVLCDTYCKDCWQEILKRQEELSQEDTDYDLAIQNEQHLQWYKFHLDKDFRNHIMGETDEDTTDEDFHNI